MPILHGRAGPSETYQRYLLCKEFGWDYHTYQAQPAFFIDELLTIMNQISEKEHREQIEQEAKLNKNR